MSDGTFNVVGEPAAAAAGGRRPQGRGAAAAAGGSGRLRSASDETFDVVDEPAAAAAMRSMSDENTNCAGGRRPPPQADAMGSVSDGNSIHAGERRGKGSAPRYGKEKKRESSPRPQPALYVLFQPKTGEIYFRQLSSALSTVVKTLLGIGVTRAQIPRGAKA